MTDTFDVILVGGRPAGAALAARLGAAGLAVLVVDKAEFPCAPEVPSCPVLYPGAMLLLDEIGFTEDRYRHATTPVRAGVIVVEPHFATRLVPPVMFGRDHISGFDRAAFDDALWQHLAGFPSVTRRAAFRVDDVLRDAGGRVTGITGAPAGRPAERRSARLAVVGADGRHSLIARKVGARVTDDRDRHTSTAHFAEWEGLTPYPGESAPIVQIVTRARGCDVLLFPSANGRVNVITHVRSDRADTGGDPRRYYLDLLRSFAAVRQRLAGARQVGPLLGVRNIANRYREAGGPGWLLVGDAVHHKDPVDGQGVYDAMIEAKRLAALLLAVHRGALADAELAPAYTRAVAEETRGMFEATMKRLDRELYQEPPAPLIRTVMRWTMSDPEYQRQFFRFLAREIPPEGWLGPGLVLRSVARGLLRDVGSLLRGRSASATS
jgi:flavin-dependent dehydrogenase